MKTTPVPYTGTMKCPRDGESLAVAQREESGVKFTTHGCAKCNGIWLSHERYESLKEIVEPKLIEFRELPAGEAQYAPLSCPQCEQTMRKGESERDKKVIVDACPKGHGIWLDAGELRAIQEESLPVFLANTLKWIAQGA